MSEMRKEIRAEDDDAGVRGKEDLLSEVRQPQGSQTDKLVFRADLKEELICAGMFVGNGTYRALVSHNSEISACKALRGIVVNQKPTHTIFGGSECPLKYDVEEQAQITTHAFRWWPPTAAQQETANISSS